LPINLSDQSLPVLFLILVIAGITVWYAGTKATYYVAAIARRTHIGEAFAGMILLGGVTSLPEAAPCDGPPYAQAEHTRGCYIESKHGAFNHVFVCSTA
jgi:hypothetical protein